MNIQPWRGGYRTTVCIPNTGPKFFANYIFLEPKFHSFLFILYSPLQSFSLSSYNSTFSTFFPLTYPKLDTYVTIGQLSKVSSFFFFAIATPSTRACPRGEKIGSRRFQEFQHPFFFFSQHPSALSNVHLKISYEQFGIESINQSLSKLSFSCCLISTNIFKKSYSVINNSFAYVRVIMIVEIARELKTNEIKCKQE